jgi:predicted phosphodiesterase
MNAMHDRRAFLRLTAISGGVVFASALRSRSASAQTSASAAPAKEFFFLQLSDTHWGFTGPAINPEADVTLKNAIAAVAALPAEPDFVVFTGDLTQTTDDPDLRRKRMSEFKAIVAGAKTKRIVFLPGEHDASLDRGKAYQEFFGPLHQSFDHEDFHFVALDNVSDPTGAVGDEQIAWLKDDLAKVDAARPIVVFAHRPLFDLYPDWDWATRDASAVLAVLEKRANVTVFYGHIHQENHHVTGAIEHHSARSLIFPLPAPGSVPKKAPLPWDPKASDHGLGFRRVAPASADRA